MEGDAVSTATVPKIVGGSLKAYWLDVECPSCGVSNRVGVTCPEEGRPCWSCTCLIDFWSAWGEEDRREELDCLNRMYWADQL